MSQPKGMSSRLLTMKFMQRAAASAASNGSTPVDSPPDSPSSRKRTEDTSSPTFKRRKIADGADVDLEAISAAVQAENGKRSAAIARQAAEAGETEWVLEFPAGTIKSATLQRDTVQTAEAKEEDGATTYEGRRSYGGFKKKRQKEDYTPSESSQQDTTVTKLSEKDQLAKARKRGGLSGSGLPNKSTHGGKQWKNRH